MERQDISYTRTLPPIALDLSNIALPKLSYAEYLTNTVIVHIGSLYSIFDADMFLQRLRRFYDDRNKDLEIDASLWHIQMLLILAFGKSIQSREHSEMGPSGMTYFTLAIEAMPDIRRLYEDPLLSIEVLCLAALFMHATDLLQEAYVTVSLWLCAHSVFVQLIGPLDWSSPASFCHQSSAQKVSGSFEILKL